MTTVREIIKAKLIEIGADGLYQDFGFERCGCSINDLAPCDDGSLECVPGYCAHGINDSTYCDEVFYESREEAEAARSKTREQLAREYDNLMLGLDYDTPV